MRLKQEIYYLKSPLSCSRHMKDKLNKVDFHWFVVRTLPHQEKKLAGMLERHMETAKNVLEVYCPTHTTVNVRKQGKETPAPLFAGIVFVLSTRLAIAEFIEKYYSEGTLMYDHNKSGQGLKPSLLTIPEEQMRLFKDFNENYSEKLVVLERPYSDYAFNPKSGEPNEIVKVVDGPLAGREGYIARFRRDKRLVFNMKTWEKGRFLTVSLPNIWDFHVVRLHNTGGDRLSIATEKGRAADLLIGMLQGCGYGERTASMLHGMIDRLVAKPSLVALCQELYKKGHTDLSRRLAQMDSREAELVINLVRYEHDNPGYVKAHWDEITLRPFLTPTSGTDMEDGSGEATLQHPGFTEYIRKVGITEQVYYPEEEKDGVSHTYYYAHIGIREDKDEEEYVLFANCDGFLGEYFLTGGKANEKLVGGAAQATNEDKPRHGKKSSLNLSAIMLLPYIRYWPKKAQTSGHGKVSLPEAAG